MQLFKTLTGAVMATVISGAAMADNVFASDPQTFMEFFFQEGYPAQLKVDAVGDPLIEFRHNSETVAMFFYDCTDNTDCLSVQFYSGYELNTPVSLAQVNDWNSGERRFTRAYTTPDGVARLEMDIATSYDGISFRDFRDLVDLWLDRVTEYEQFIGW